jgi:hypothetical protein
VVGRPRARRAEPHRGDVAAADVTDGWGHIKALDQVAQAQSGWAVWSGRGQKELDCGGNGCGRDSGLPH